MFIFYHESSLFTRIARLYLALIFTVSSLLVPTASSAETILNLPPPGTLLSVSEAYVPAMIRGIIIHPENPLKFNFIVDTGHSGIAINSEDFRIESKKMIKYFLASLTVPEKATWVNLSPYEENRIISKELGRTEMGRDMLAQDYLLKQLTASLMYPEEELGQAFWKRVHAQASERYGTAEIPVETLSKVWIVPDKAVVYEQDNSVYVVERHLKVMLEEDFVGLNIHQKNKTFEESPLGVDAPKTKALRKVASEVVREILIPEIEKEVNTGKHFAPLRQIYNSMILAAWYKKSLKESLLGQVYVDQSKTQGIDLDDTSIHQKIYDQYVEAFKREFTTTSEKT